MADGALIVQSDRSVLLEVDHPKADAARAAIAPFAELEKSPEHVHTYRLTPLALWNARAAGLDADAGRRRPARAIPLPGAAGRCSPTWSRTWAATAAWSCGPARDGLELRQPPTRPCSRRSSAAARSPRTSASASSPDRVAVPPAERGRLKQALLALGWPAEDQAGYVEGAALPIELWPRTRHRRGFGLRRYQREAVDAFCAARVAGSIVLPCGAGKTLVGLGAMAAVGARTLILVTTTVAARQWRDELLARPTSPPARSASTPGSARRSRPVTIATYQILITRPQAATSPHFELFDAEDWGLIVYDEVHLLPAPVFRMTAEIQARRRLGLTATLVREDGREDDVFSLIGPKKYDVPWRDLEAQGWIAAADCLEVRVGLTDERADGLRPGRVARASTAGASANPVKDDRWWPAWPRHDRPTTGSWSSASTSTSSARSAEPLDVPLITGADLECRARGAVTPRSGAASCGRWSSRRWATSPSTCPTRTW